MRWKKDETLTVRPAVFSDDRDGSSCSSGLWRFGYSGRRRADSTTRCALHLVALETKETMPRDLESPMAWLSFLWTGLPAIGCNGAEGDFDVNLAVTHSLLGPGALVGFSRTGVAFDHPGSTTKSTDIKNPTEFPKTQRSDVRPGYAISPGSTSRGDVKSPTDCAPRLAVSMAAAPKWATSFAGRALHPTR